ncbi:AMP-binding protein [Phyllobacterium sp. YR531]|uniref:phenylacetate--CoA ligase family protein n=1 Tax=Phyllobacterium sp. YR531 TaxID=1144343 RepID=UPI00329A0CD2
MSLARALQEQTFWAKHFAEVDVSIVTNRAKLSELPILRKSALPSLQQAAPPFGGLNASSLGDLARLFISPGPIFDPEGHGRDWWGSARALYAAGVRKGDVVLNTFSYHLTPAGAMFESGAHALGCAVIPAGPGNTADQLMAIAQYRPNTYVGTPDFLKILLDKARETGRDTSFLRRALVSGAALPTSLREELEERGITVRQCYGTADLGIIAYEGDSPGMVINEGILLEIVRPGTCESIPHGEVGEIVITRANRDYPLFRFATGDLSCIIDEPSPDGRTNLRIKGWLGRADQTTKIKGMFVRPEQIDLISKRISAPGRLRLIVTRANEQDSMTLMVEQTHADNTDSIANALFDATKLRGKVQIVPPGTLPNDGKVISDERKYE